MNALAPRGKPSLAERLYDALARRRFLVLALLALALIAGAVGALGLRIDMSFRPTFIGAPAELARTGEHERIFGQVGFRDLIALADVRDARDPQALTQVSRLAERLGRLPHVVEVRDPLHFPFFDRNGAAHPLGVAGALGAGQALDSEPGRAWIEELLHSASARRLLIGDGDRRVAVMASIDLPNEDFARRREVVAAFRSSVRDWAAETGIATQVTGYPEVEQVYAEEVLQSVFRSIGALIAMMLVILFVYFRRWSDVLTCLAGVSLSVPMVLGLMALLGQPFSIVNSQVLTLVLIVGIGQALHHQEEYRRRREAGRAHQAANREAFAILAWPSFMTGLATSLGFAALTTADMRAIWSFGVCTALGVLVVYVTNWLVVPPLIERFYRAAPAHTFVPVSSWTLSIVRGADRLLQAHPWRITLGFFALALGLAAAGLTGLRIDQKVNEELPPAHPALSAQSTYEREFAGFLGPELSIVPESGPLDGAELAAFVNRLCEMPEVRYVASPLDLLPQPGVAAGKACSRQSGELAYAVLARQGAAGPAIERLATALLSESGDRANVVVRVADIGTAHSLPFVERVRAAARETMPHARVEPVGQWWLAQQGMARLSFDVMLSAITALLVILPLMWLSIRDLRLFLAAIPPTILPVLATLGFMGLTHITVRIGTAMILAIALGLAADDTIHLSVRIRDRVRAGSDPGSAVTATLLRTGRPCSFSSYVLIGGFASMLASSLSALQAMGVIAMFTMTFALASDVVLGPALYLLLARSRRTPAQSEALTLRGLLADVLRRHPERPALGYREDAAPAGDTPAADTAAPRTRSLSWHELGSLVLELTEALPHWLGAAQCVAVLADSDARYPILELAVALGGRTLQPLYCDASDEELRRALATSGATVLVVGCAQRARAAALALPLLELEALVPLPGLAAGRAAILPPEAEPFDSTRALARLAALPPRAADVPLLYLQSTGTTGPARVIELSEAALMCAVGALRGEASHEFPRLLSFLPTGHISERLLSSYVSLALAADTWHGDGLAGLTQDLRWCRPTLLFAPPLLLSAIRDGALAQSGQSGLGRWLARSLQASTERLLLAGATGAARRSAGAWLFGASLRRGTGLDKVRDTFSGTAPLSAELHAWCEAARLPLRIVYGQTELAGATTISPRRGARFGAVGVPLGGVETRISASGELLARSRALCTRYVGDAAASARVLEDGWLHTGDRAELLPSGELRLRGRVQSLVLRGPHAFDLEPFARQLRERWGRVDVVSHPLPGGGLALYVALHPEALGVASAPSSVAPAPVPDADRRWDDLEQWLEAADPARIVEAWALLAGALPRATAELGPTGKPRGWRVHELRAPHLRWRAPVQVQPPVLTGAAALC